ncbi:unnamed protein product, partial [Mesorhabditis belari]|uniref:Uncharacterized protein n=1 Tax=Mesorhabditis belari TaxID=2138241 RepID=A0AAF3F5B0_9BILA
MTSQIENDDLFDENEENILGKKRRKKPAIVVPLGARNRDSRLKDEQDEESIRIALLSFSQRIADERNAHNFEEEGQRLGPRNSFEEFLLSCRCELYEYDDGFYFFLSDNGTHAELIKTFDGVFSNDQTKVFTLLLKAIDRLSENSDSTNERLGLACVAQLRYLDFVVDSKRISKAIVEQDLTAWRMSVRDGFLAALPEVIADPISQEEIALHLQALLIERTSISSRSSRHSALSSLLLLRSDSTVAEEISSSLINAIESFDASSVLLIVELALKSSELNKNGLLRTLNRLKENLRVESFENIKRGFYIVFKRLLSHLEGTSAEASTCLSALEALMKTSFQVLASHTDELRECLNKLSFLTIDSCIRLYRLFVFIYTKGAQQKLKQEVCDSIDHFSKSTDSRLQLWALLGLIAQFEATFSSENSDRETAMKQLLKAIDEISQKDPHLRATWFLSMAKILKENRKISVPKQLLEWTMRLIEEFQKDFFKDRGNNYNGQSELEGEEYRLKSKIWIVVKREEWPIFVPMLEMLQEFLHAEERCLKKNENCSKMIDAKILDLIFDANFAIKQHCDVEEMSIPEVKTAADVLFYTIHALTTILNNFGSSCNEKSAILHKKYRLLIACQSLLSAYISNITEWEVPKASFEQKKTQIDSLSSETRESVLLLLIDIVRIALPKKERRNSPFNNSSTKIDPFYHGEPSKIWKFMMKSIPSAMKREWLKEAHNTQKSQTSARFSSNSEYFVGMLNSSQNLGNSITCKLVIELCEVCPSLEVAVILSELANNISDESTDGQREVLGLHLLSFLRREWVDIDYKPLKAVQLNASVFILFQKYISIREKAHRLVALEWLTLVKIAQVLSRHTNRQVTNSIDDPLIKEQYNNTPFGCINKTTFTGVYRAALSSLNECVNESWAKSNMLSSRISTPTECIEKWAQAAGIFAALAAMLEHKSLRSTAMLIAFAREGRKFVLSFIKNSSFFEAFEKLKVSEKAHRTLKAMQVGSRHLQQISIYAKQHKSPILLRALPELRACGESFLRTVRSIMVKIGCEETMVFGLLVARDIDGEKIVSDEAEDGNEDGNEVPTPGETNNEETSEVNDEDSRTSEVY